jgi:hypothetical protein
MKKLHALDSPRYDRSAPHAIRPANCGLKLIKMTNTSDHRNGTVTADETAEAWLDQLEREGKVTRGTSTLPEWFFTAPRQQVEGSVVDQLLADRRKNDW